MEIIINAFRRRYHFVEKEKYRKITRGIFWISTILILIGEFIYWAVSNNILMGWVVGVTVWIYVSLDLIFYHKLVVTKINSN